MSNPESKPHPCAVPEAPPLPSTEEYRSLASAGNDLVTVPALTTPPPPTGRLEHPDFVPISALDEDELGHSYYAMRLIARDNLQQPIEGFPKRTNAAAADERGGRSSVIVRRICV